MLLLVRLMLIVLLLFWERKSSIVCCIVSFVYCVLICTHTQIPTFSQYDGDKWDNFYEKIPISLLHHTNGNAIYNTSHPLLERLVGQLEVEAPCPYNSIPYDYRMSQMWVEGTLESLRLYCFVT